MPFHTALPPLRNVLADLYGTEGDARRVANDAGLNRNRIDFSGAAIWRWTDILNEAENTNRVEAIIAIAQDEYRDSQALRKAIHDYRTLPRHNADIDLENLPAPGDPPYQGLQYFDVDDADRFFGRERLTAELTGLLRTNRFLAVVGASGSGKSSVVRAGVIPALRAGAPLTDDTLPPRGSPDWLVRIITPGAQPLKTLAAALTRESESVGAQTALMDDLAANSRSFDLFVARWLTRSPAAHLLLVVDQFEEIFTLCKDAVERRRFIDNLLTAAQPDGPFTLIITLRADFYHRCAAFDNLRVALEGRQKFIGAMSKAERRAAIEKPAEQGDWTFEPGLVDVMLADVADEPGALPLLSYALLETWRNRRGRVMTYAGYFDAGGVKGAITSRADAEFEALSPHEQQVARNIFIRLTEFSESGNDTRRQTTRDELLGAGEDPDTVTAVLATLGAARLITTKQEAVEVAHEALIRAWPRLRTWIDEQREAEIVRRRLEDKAVEWARLGRGEAGLLDEYEVHEAEAWFDDRADSDLSASEDLRNLIAASRQAIAARSAAAEAARQRELTQERRLAAEQRQRAEEEAAAASRVRRLLYIVSAFGAVALVAALVAVNSYMRQQEATNRALISDAELRAEESLRTLSIDPRNSISLAVEALSNPPNRPDVPRAEFALNQAIRTNQQVAHLEVDAREAAQIAVHPDGRHIALGGSQLTIVDQQLADENVLPLADDAYIDGVDWAQNGQLLAYQQQDGLVWTGVPDDGLTLATALREELEGESITCARWSPTAAEIALCIKSSEKVSVARWHVTDETLLHSANLGNTDDPHVMWSADGQRLFAWGLGGRACIDDGTTRGNGPCAGTLLSEETWKAGQSSSGRYVAVAPQSSEDNLVEIWDTHSMTITRRITGTERVAGMRFLSRDEDKPLLFVWSSLELSVEAVEQAALGDGASQRIPSPNLRIDQILFSPDSRRLAVFKADGSAITYDVEGMDNVDAGLALQEKTGEVEIAQWVEDYLLIGGTDGQVRVFDAGTGELVSVLVGHKESERLVDMAWQDGLLLTAAFGEAFDTPGSLRTWRIFDERGEILCRRTRATQVNRCTNHSQLIPVYAETKVEQVSWGANDVLTVETGNRDLYCWSHLAWPAETEPTDKCQDRAAVNTIVWSPDGKRVLTYHDDVDNDREGELWSLVDGAWRRYAQIRPPVTDAWWLTQGLLVSSGDELLFFDLTAEISLDAPCSAVRDVIELTPHQVALACSNGIVYLGDLESEEGLQPLPGNGKASGAFANLKSTSDGRFLYGLYALDGTIIVWDTQAPNSIVWNKPVGSGIGEISLSPKGNYLAVPQPAEGLRIYATENDEGEPVWTSARLDPNRRTGYQYAKWIEGEGDRNLQLLTASTSEDGETGSAQIWHWDETQQKPEIIAEVSHRLASEVDPAVSPDGTRLLTVDHTGRLRAWVLWSDVEDLLAAAEPTIQPQTEEDRRQ